MLNDILYTIDTVYNWQGCKQGWTTTSGDLGHLQWALKLLTPLIKISKINNSNTEQNCMQKTLGKLYYIILIQLLREQYFVLHPFLNPFNTLTAPILFLKCFMSWRTHWEESYTIPPYRILPDPWYPLSALMDCQLQFKPKVFNGFQIQRLRWWILMSAGWSTCRQVSASWQRQPDFGLQSWYWVMMPLILTRAPGPVEAK